MNSHEHPDRLDQILLEQDALLPSSGFASAVMNSIQQEATAPAPILFPWKLALPGIAALLAGIIVLCRLVLITIRGMSLSSASGLEWLAWLRSSTQTAMLIRTEVAPALLALAASWVCVLLSRKLAGGWSTR